MLWACIATSLNISSRLCSIKKSPNEWTYEYIKKIPSERKDAIEILQPTLQAVLLLFERQFARTSCLIEKIFIWYRRRRKKIDENPWRVRDISYCAEFALLSGREERTAEKAGSKSQKRKSFRTKFAEPRKYGTIGAKECKKKKKKERPCGSFLSYIIFWKVPD